MPILTAPATGAPNPGSRLPGACASAKLMPCTATDPNMRTPALAPNTVTDGGSTSSRVILDTASWLPRMRQVAIPAASSRPSSPARNRAVFIEVCAPSYRSPAISSASTASRRHRSTMPRNASRVAVPTRSDRAGSRSASDRSGESRWMSAVWTKRKGKGRACDVGQGATSGIKPAKSNPSPDPQRQAR